MRPDYKNWVPSKLIAALAAGCAACFALALLFAAGGLNINASLRACLTALFGAGFLVCLFFTFKSIAWRRAFDYNGTRQLSRHITEGVAAFVEIPDGGVGLDVGCGSGALTIACAKRNPKAEMVGLDRWGREYKPYSRELCESNAAAEGVGNIRFVQGDATRLDFPDESFDAVVSNYVYHNITGADKQALLLETLRVLRPGGLFAIHDIMSPMRYGDMRLFAENLRKAGYKEVSLIPTDDGRFMSKREARSLSLSGSTLLFGRK